MIQSRPCALPHILQAPLPRAHPAVGTEFWCRPGLRNAVSSPASVTKQVLWLKVGISGSGDLTTALYIYMDTVYHI